MKDSDQPISIKILIASNLTRKYLNLDPRTMHSYLEDDTEASRLKEHNSSFNFVEISVNRQIYYLKNYRVYFQKVSKDLQKC